ncbi:Ig-like domain-containing protein [Microvirga zambiensis]|uniref:Ig-like domain-containing protein n=1 Tax=Microvirga zambiensis TaxID=1402137 RepID=UPI00191EFBB2|nr:Ig-like domain-containing protein [Microvirga zambiensis]
MSQQPDLTIPFDASVLDEEALRTLRAVQRMVPAGDGGSNSNLVGGTEAVAAFGMVPGAPSGTASVRPFQIATERMEGTVAREEAPSSEMDLAPSNDNPALVEAALSDDVPMQAPAAPQSSPAPKAAISSGSSSYVPDTSAAVAFAPEAVKAGADLPDDQVALPQPPTDEPAEEQPQDLTAEAPLVQAGDAEGQEDQPIALNLSAALADTDGSELLSIKIFGVPEGATLTHGTRQSDGSWSVSPADLADLAIIPPENFSGTFNLTLRATSQESNGETAATEVVFQVQVHAVADAPSVAVADAHGQEDAAVSLAGLGGALRDTDGSESLSFVISGVPAGTTLSAGTSLGGGRWALSPAQLEGLTLTPPAHFSGQFNLTLTAIATESEAGVPSARTSASFVVSLDPGVDAASIGGASQGAEDTPILVQPAFLTPDMDGSETWSEFTQVAGVPAGATLSRGTEIAPGVWQVSTADLRGGLVSVRPAVHSDADFTLTLTTTLTDSGNGTSVSRVVTGTHAVTVDAIADAPAISASNAAGDEDQPIPLNLSAALVDNDGSEVLSVNFLGVPDGASLSHGTRQPDGSWSVSPADLAHVFITPPADFAGTIDLTLRATAHETSNGSTAVRSVDFQVVVADVSDAPSVTTQDASGREDESIALALSAALTDTDGSEILSVAVLGVPSGASLSHGSRAADGSWVVDPNDLPNLLILPPANFSGTIDLTLRATSVSANGVTATTNSPFHVAVEAVADAPAVAVHDAAGQEDQAIALDLSAMLTDTDTSEVLSVTIEGLPQGARLSAGTDNGDGTWSVSPAQLAGLTLTPPANWSGTMALSLVAQSREISNGSTATTRAGFQVSVEAVADAPVLVAHDVRGLEDTAITLDLSATLQDRDGSELLSVSIFGVPAGASLSHGIRQADGSWSVSPSDLAHLKLTPVRDFSGPLNLRMEATTRESSNGDTETIAADFRVQVGAVADTPDVVVANFSGREDEPVALTGLGGALRDLDGSESLSFLLTVPAGATLNAGVKQADGSWLLTPAQLSGLILTPPPHGSGQFQLTLTAVATESEPGVPSARNSASFTVNLDPVLDAGSITGSAAGNEDSWITIRPTYDTPDKDNSETWSEFTRVSGVPSGATLNRGNMIEPGVWSVPTGDLRSGQVKIKPPAHSDEDFTLTFTATLQDTGNGKTVSGEVTGTSRVTVNAVADAPSVTATSVSGNEDGEISLNLSAALVDRDGSETLAVRIYGVPADASLTKGTLQSDGSWLVRTEDLPQVALKPPLDFSGTIDLKIRATASESSNGSKASTEVPFQVKVEAVADAPGLRVNHSVGDEDTAIPLNMAAWTTDRDGSEKIVGFRIAGIPEGAVVRAGSVVLVRAADGSVLVDPAQVNGLTITPPAHSDKDFTLKVSAISAEPNGSTAESQPLDLHVTVRAVADAPIMDVTGATGFEDTPIALNLSATMPDADGSETLSFVISGIPEGAVLSHGTYRGPGTWSLTAEEARQATLLPPRDFSGTIELRVTAVTQEADGGDQAKTPVRFPVNVVAVVDTPAVGGLDGHSGNWGTMAGTEDQPIALRLDPGLRDSDNSEKVVGDILIGNVPNGAVLKLADGTILAADVNGIYRIPAAQMTGVTLTMPHDSDQAATLTVEMTVEDTGGVRATIGGHMVVDPAGDADTPVLTLTESTGTGHNSFDPDEGLIPLHIAATPGDTDGSESLYMWVRDVPNGAVLSAGIPAGEGVWLVPVEALSDLSIRPPAGFSGSFDLKVTAVAVEREGDQSHLTEEVTVTITAPSGGGSGGGGGDGSGTVPGSAPVAQAPALAVADAVTAEDRSVQLSISAGTADSDNGRETLGIRIDGVPAGASLSVGVRDPLTGTWVLRPEQLVNVSLLPPADFSGTISLRVTAVSTEATGSQTTTTSDLNVTVSAVADSAVIAAAPPAGVEDVAVPLNLSVGLSDRDGSESVAAVVISGLPAGSRLEGTGLTDIGNGRWSVDPAHLGSLNFVPPPNKYGTYTLTVEATTREASNGDTLATSRTIAISVAPSADAPVVTVHDATGNEDGRIALNLSASLTDTDGSEVLSIVIEGLPEGARLSAGLNNGDGSWTLTPAQLAGLTVTPPGDWSGTMALTMLAHSRETSNGSVKTTTETFDIHVGATADAPVVSARDAAGREDEPIGLKLSALLTDRDGSETLSVVISGMPSGAFLSHGTRQPDGSWLVSPSDLPNLAVTPPQNFSGSFGLTLRATSRETSGETATTEATFRVQVDAVADAPSVTVVNFSGSEDTSIRLTGLGGALIDTDGSESLNFVLSGLPAGASLSAGTKQADGSWLLTPAQLSGVTFIPPAQVSGSFTLTLTGIAAESTGGSSARTSVDFTVSLDPVADAGTIAGSSAGSEDTAILLKPTFTLTDNDGSETWSEFTQVSGMPQGASLNLGTELSPGLWQVATADLRAGLVTILPAENSDADFTLTLKATITDSGNGTSVSREITGTHSVAVAAVADAPVVVAGDSSGLEDHAIALNLSAVLVDTDGSEALTVTILGVHDGFTLSHGTAAGGGAWTVPAASLPSLQLMPPQDWNGTLNLTLQATSRESTGQTATTTTAFTVTVDAVNDAPELALVAPDHAEAGSHQAHAIGGAEAEDIDSAHLGGATITLSGAQPGDRLDLDGFVLHQENGRTMIGDTGIEIVGGGYAAGTGTLTLSGHATPETYSSVLEALVLESGDASGLAAGSRSLGVTLIDSEGAASAERSVEVIVDASSEASVMAASADGAGTMQDLAGSDMLLLMADGVSDPSHGAGAAWTDQIGAGDASASGAHPTPDLDQPAADHVQPLDDFQADASRLQWS